MRSSRLNVHPVPHTLSVPAPFFGGGSLLRSPSRARAHAQMACMSSGPLPECALRVGRPGPAASRCHGSPNGLDEDQRPQSASRRARACMRRLACASVPDHTHTLWWDCYHLHIRLLKSVQKRCGRSHPRLALMSPSFHPTQEAPHLGPFAGSSRAYLLPAGRRGGGGGQESASQGEFHFRTNVRGHTETVASGFYLLPGPQASRLNSGPQSRIVFWSERPLKPKDQQFADIKQTKATAHLWLDDFRKNKA